MSTPKLSLKKSKKGTKGSKTDEECVLEPGGTLECQQENAEDIRTVVITIQSLKNVLPLYPTADVKATLKYLDKSIGESKIIPVTDDRELPVDESFEIEVDVNSAKQMDLLASYPVFIYVVQQSGVLDSTFYEQLKRSEEGKEVEQVDSLFSMYEAFTGERPSVEEGRKKKKGKADKSSDKTLKEKSTKRTQSVASKGSKSSKKSGVSNQSDKASRKEKSEVYGMSVVDLIPLFYGEMSFTETLLIKPIKQTDQLLSTYKNAPEMLVEISVKEDIKLVDINNILHFTVESICNIPFLMGANMDCKVCVMLPLHDNSRSPTVFQNPKVTSTAPPKQIQKRWPGIQDIGYNSNATKYPISYAYDDIINKTNLNIEEAYREEATRLEFNYIKRNVLFRGGHNDFVTHVRTYNKLVIEIFLTPKTKHSTRSFPDDTVEDSQSQGKSKGTKVTPPHLHLMASIDIISLMYPGVNRLHIAAPVTTFTYDEAAKRGLEDSFFMPKPKSVDVMDARSKVKLDNTKKKKENKEKKDNITVNKKEKDSGRGEKNLASQLPPMLEEPPPPEPTVQVYNEDGKPCFIVVEIELLKPITPKKEPEELKSELYLIQMQALQTCKIIVNKNVSEEYYHQTITEILDDLNNQWVNYSEMSKMVSAQTSGDFLDYLKKTGAYQSYLNSITTAATFLINNKYKCEEQDFRNSRSYQNLVSEMYVDLIARMHGILNSLICTGMKPITDKYSIPRDVSYFYAKEAAELKLYTTAGRYFMERIIGESKENSDFWFDYAVYNLELGDTEKAFECVKNSIAIKCTNKYSLLLYGAQLTDKRYEHDAEICFLNILILDSKWVEGWCVLYLFYHKTGSTDGTEMALNMASRIFDQSVIVDYISEFEDLAWSWKNIPDTLFFRTAILLLKMRLYSWVELALAEEVLVPKHYGYVNYLLAVMSYYKKDYDHALEHINEAKESLGADFGILALSGHILLAKEMFAEARDEYLKVIESYNKPDDIHLVYLNCAEVLAKLGDDQTARKFILTACKLHQTPHVWFSAGKLYYQENDILSAEECFNEANIKDNRHAEIWGYLVLVNLGLNRMHEAEQCYQQAMKCNLANEELLRTIIQEFDKDRSSLDCE